MGNVEIVGTCVELLDCIDWAPGFALQARASAHADLFGQTMPEGDPLQS
jgi:hypothetical protein